MPSIHFYVPGEGGCLYHRQNCPVTFLHKDYEKYGWEFSVGDWMPPNHDVYVVHGLPEVPLMLNIATLKRRGKRIVWGVDDDWLSIPDWNPAKPQEIGLVVYDLMKHLADYILVSTPHLSTTFADVAHKVLVAPNLLDLERFPKPPTVYDEGTGLTHYALAPKSVVRLMWSGGSTHSGDLEEMTDALYRIMDRYTSDQCVVLFQGMMPPSKLIRKYLHRGKLWHQPPVPFSSHQQIINSMDPHVYLAPLAPVEFNKSKSPLRILEGWALCACPVATDFGEYGTTVVAGENGRLVTDTESWYSALKRVIDDPEYRVTMAMAGRRRVDHEYNWALPANRTAWTKAFDTILQVG